jgi:hypothetical protein
MTSCTGSAATAARRTATRHEGVQVHGRWVSLPHEPWQNACWCLSIDEALSDQVVILQAALSRLAEWFDQDSIAWAEVNTEFIGGAPSEVSDGR